MKFFYAKLTHLCRQPAHAMIDEARNCQIIQTLVTYYICQRLCQYIILSNTPTI